MRKYKSKIIFSFLFLCLSLWANLEVENEYILKAAVLVRIPLHFDWPEHSPVNDKSAPFIISVLGKNPFGSTLDKACEQLKIKNKAVKIVYLSKLEEIVDSGCNLLFISESNKKRLAEIIAIISDKPILTIGDSKDFAELGVQLNILVKKNKLRFEINLQAVRESGLVMNYHLLEDKYTDKVINR